MLFGCRKLYVIPPDLVAQCVKLAFCKDNKNRPQPQGRWKSWVRMNCTVEYSNVWQGSRDIRKSGMRSALPRY